jgi:hypothetical protein
MLTECYSGLSFKFFLHFSMRFFTLESLRRTIIWRGGKARPCPPTNSENEKLREDLDALEQYDRRELMCINGIPDGGQEETTAKTTKLVTDGENHRPVASH